MNFKKGLKLVSMRNSSDFPAPPPALFIVPSVAKVNCTSGFLRQGVLSIFLNSQAQRDDVALPCPNIERDENSLLRAESGHAAPFPPNRVNRTNRFWVFSTERNVDATIDVSAGEITTCIVP